MTVLNGYCYNKALYSLPYCDYMLNSYSCQQCQPGYIVAGNGTCTMPADFSCNVPYCLSCKTNNTCWMCDPQYQLDNGTCIPKNCSESGCQSCLNSTYCDTCNTNYLNMSGSCALPAYGCSGVKWCSKCIQTDSCAVCDMSYSLVLLANGKYGCIQVQCPTNITNCMYCGYNYNPALKLKVSCMACDSGWNLVGGYCLANLQNYTCSTTNCSSCAWTDYCQDCMPGSRVMEGSCMVQECNIPYCTSCANLQKCEVCATNFTVTMMGFCTPINDVINCNTTGCSYCLYIDN